MTPLARLGWRCAGLCAAAVLHASSLAATSTPTPVKLDSDAQRAAYVAGYRFGNSLRTEGAELDADVIARGLKDAMSGQAAALPEAQHADAINAWRQSREHAAAAANIEAGRKFLEDNARKPGVVTLPSGLQYQVLQSGQGASPQPNDMVKVHYRGTLINGIEFDSSHKRGKPASFAVDQVIAGWTEALQKMKAGDKWMLFIPSDLAYGSRKMGKIEPGSTLIFEVELLEVIAGAQR